MREQGEFGFGEVNSFSPRYGDVDWRDLLIERLNVEADGEKRPVWFTAADDYRFQVTQDNCFVFLNSAHDSLDCINLVDPRDGLGWFIYRDELAEKFDLILNNIGHAAAFIHSPYPNESIVDVFFKHELKDLAEADSFPEVWEHEKPAG